MKAGFKFSWVDIKSIHDRVGIVLVSSLGLPRTSVNRKEGTAEECVEKGNLRNEAHKTKLCSGAGKSCALQNYAPYLSGGMCPF